MHTRGVVLCSLAFSLLPFPVRSQQATLTTD
jgi:hypothetical protein